MGEMKKSVKIRATSPKKSQEKSNSEKTLKNVSIVEQKNKITHHYSIIKSLVNSNYDPIELIEKKPWQTYKKINLKKESKYALQFNKLM